MGYFVCLIIGAMIGYFIFALVTVAKKADDEEERRTPHD